MRESDTLKETALSANEAALLPLTERCLDKSPMKGEAHQA